MHQQCLQIHYFLSLHIYYISPLFWVEYGTDHHSKLNVDHKVQKVRDLRSG